jgi:hypothetical protein
MDVATLGQVGLAPVQQRAGSAALGGRNNLHLKTFFFIKIEKNTITAL